MVYLPPGVESTGLVPWTSLSGNNLKSAQHAPGQMAARNLLAGVYPKEMLVNNFLQRAHQHMGAHLATPLKISAEQPFPNRCDAGVLVVARCQKLPQTESFSTCMWVEVRAQDTSQRQLDPVFEPGPQQCFDA